MGIVYCVISRHRLSAKYITSIWNISVARNPFEPTLVNAVTSVNRSFKSNKIIKYI